MKRGRKTSFVNDAKGVNHFLDSFLRDNISDETERKTSLYVERAIVKDAGDRYALRHEKKTIRGNNAFVACMVENGRREVEGMNVRNHLCHSGFPPLESFLVYWRKRPSVVKRGITTYLLEPPRAAVTSQAVFDTLKEKRKRAGNEIGKFDGIGRECTVAVITKRMSKPSVAHREDHWQSSSVCYSRVLQGVVSEREDVNERKDSFFEKSREHCSHRSIEKGF